MTSLANLKELVPIYKERLALVGYASNKDFKFANPKVKVYQENFNNPFKPKSKLDLIFEPVSGFEANRKSIINELRKQTKEELVDMVWAKGMLESVAQTQTDLRTKNKDELIEIIVQASLLEEEVERDSIDQKPVAIERNMTTMQANILYRFFMWHEMFTELISSKAIIGVDFGKPFRSKMLQLLRFDESWKTRVGWLEPHNSYVHMLYRAGIIGFLIIAVMWGLFIKITKIFIIDRNIKGILLSSCLLYWLLISNFMVILELPYHAIPFWCLFGMTLRYCHNHRTQAKECGSK